MKPDSLARTPNTDVTEVIRVCGTVQGVGFRPTVYRLARECGLRGEVSNDGLGVFIIAAGDRTAIDTFVARLQAESPPLAKIESIARHSWERDRAFSDFRIVPSTTSAIHTQIAPDAATCPACKAETFDPLSRWYRYPFTNCTHCGPRLSLIKGLPYDRANTSMAAFSLCPDCQQDYENPLNRRFHAQPTACHTCGPNAWLERADGKPITDRMFSVLDDIDAVCTLLQQGQIVAIKGLGGFHLACDATNEAAVQKLRQRKNRPDKPLALMARDLEVIEQYCVLSEAERELLQSPAAPIVLLRKKENFTPLTPGQKNSEASSILPGRRNREASFNSPTEKQRSIDRLSPNEEIAKRPLTPRQKNSEASIVLPLDKGDKRGIVRGVRGGSQGGREGDRKGDKRGIEKRGKSQIPNQIAPSVAPGLNVVGFMIPYTPLHHLILKRCDRPIVLTSGNLSEEPQCIENEDAKQRLGQIADYFLFHNRDIVNRIDDSVVRYIHSPLNSSVDDSAVQRIDSPLGKGDQGDQFLAKGDRGENEEGKLQILRRARGYAPAPIDLPEGFDNTPPILGMGSELKNTFCLFREGQAILSQHLGDLENALASQAYRDTLNLYLHLFEHQPTTIAVDLHPEYLSTKLGKELAIANSLKLETIQHHHAHVAACMADNSLPLDTPPVLGIALDGLGYGEDGTLWGGEFLLADYRGFQRLATFKPVLMLGGEQAIYQPWRNTYAHLREWGSPLAPFIKGGIFLPFSKEVAGDRNSGLELFAFLQQKPLKLLNQMAEKGINSPLASSCGRLFDAVAAAIGICRESCSYEGQGAILLEARAENYMLNNSEEIRAYPFSLGKLESIQLPYIEPRPMWEALLEDLRNNAEPSLMAAKFHIGLANAIASMVALLQQRKTVENAREINSDRSSFIAHRSSFHQVALTGGVFQNCVLLKLVSDRIAAMGLEVLTHSQVPPNDGGLSLGQAAIACARISDG